MVKLITLFFSVCFATGYIHSGEIKIFKKDENAQTLVKNQRQRKLELKLAMMKNRHRTCA